MPFRLLVVDDDPSVRNYLSAFLTHAGYEIVTAADVPSALHVMAQRETDLLITDVRLDGYNGLHLVAMAPDPIPAVVMTGFVDSAVEAEARKLGADYFLKPVDGDQLLEAIGRLLRGLNSST